MSYRDDRDALKVRVELLEQELEDARKTVKRLRGEPAPALSSSSRTNQTVLLREVDVEPSDLGLRAIADLARFRLGRGTTAIVGRELRHEAAGVELHVVPSPTGARITLAFRFAWRALAAVLTAATAIVAALISGGVAQALGAPRWSALVIISAWLCVLGVLWAWRLRTAFEQMSARHRGLLEAAADIAVAYPRATTGVVGAEDDDRAQADAQAEADALSESDSAGVAARL